VRIGLINAYSTLNLGDAAIYAGLRSLMPGMDLVACVRDDQPDSSLGIHFIDHPPRDCDAYVSVGGDIFNNAREWFVTRTFLENLRDLRRHSSRTVLFGQSIPRSCHGVSFYVLSRVLRRLQAVCVRDAESHARLSNAGVKALLSFDTAFALEGSDAGRSAAAELYRGSAIDPGLAVVLSVRAFDTMYSHDNEGFIRNIVELCAGIQERGRVPVVLIQSRAYGADNDLEVARAIVQGAPGTAILDPFAAAQELSAWQVAMGVLALAARVIAVRYHTAVLSLATGRLPYSLHYSNKGRDLCERLGLPGCDLAALRPSAVLDELFMASSHGFDHRAIREQVRSDFGRCLGRVPAPAVA
jgi:polysaccharide pyruvyl transferase WcaK-like protein